METERHDRPGPNRALPTNHSFQDGYHLPIPALAGHNLLNNALQTT